MLFWYNCAVQQPGAASSAVRHEAAAIALVGRAPWLRPPLRVLRRPLQKSPPFFATASDCSPGRRASRTIIVASEARTGSALLCSALARSGVVGFPEEYFEESRMVAAAEQLGVPELTVRARFRQQWRRWTFRPGWMWSMDFRPSSFDDYLDRLFSLRTTSNGVFAIKVHWSQYQEMNRRYGLPADRFPQPVTWIHIRRADLAAQAASVAKARRTKMWSDRGMPAPRLGLPSVRYDDVAMLAAYRLAREGCEGWERFFDEQGIEPIRVVYEELAADYSGTVVRVLKELGLEAAVAKEPELRRQADHVNEQWAQRFRSEHPELFDSEQL